VTTQKNVILTVAVVDNGGYSPQLSRRIREYMYRSLMNMQSAEIATVIKMASVLLCNSVFQTST